MGSSSNYYTTNTRTLVLASVLTVAAAAATAVILFTIVEKRKRGDIITILEEEDFWKIAQEVAEGEMKCMADFRRTSGYKGREVDMMQDPTIGKELSKRIQKTLEQLFHQRGITRDVFEASHKAYIESNAEGQRKFDLLTLHSRRKVRMEEEEEKKSTDDDKRVLDKQELLEICKIYGNAIGHCSGEFALLRGYTDADKVNIFSILRNQLTGPHLRVELSLVKERILCKRKISHNAFHKSLKRYYSNNKKEPKLEFVWIIEKTIVQEEAALSLVVMRLSPDNNNNNISIRDLEKEKLLHALKVYYDTCNNHMVDLVHRYKQKGMDDNNLSMDCVEIQAAQRICVFTAEEVLWNHLNITTNDYKMLIEDFMTDPIVARAAYMLQSRNRKQLLGMGVTLNHNNNRI